MLDKLKNLSDNEKKAIGALIAVAFIVLADKVVVQYVGNRLTQIDNDISVQTKSLDYNQAVIASGEKIADRYEVAKAQIPEFTVADEAINMMKESIGDLGERTGLDINAMSHREPKQFDYYVEYLVDIKKFETDITHLLAFLNEVHEADGLLRVSKVTIEPVKGTDRIKGAMLISKIMVPGEDAVLPDEGDE